MKTQFEFRSDKFPPYDGEEDQLNPGIWGRRLAEYLVEKLSEANIETAEMMAQDWGWYIPIGNERLGWRFVAAIQDADDGFSCFTDPNTPIFRRGFKKIDATADFTRLTETLHQIRRAVTSAIC